jgi:pimeloyl-ACP methyl ester carboxylesterase
MTQLTERVLNGVQLTGKIQEVLNRRTESARQRFAERADSARKAVTAEAPAPPVTPFDWWKQWVDYAVDFTQRSILFYDTLRQRGNIFVEHERAGKPPVLHFEYETVLDGRTFERPVNYALLRIKPPEGVTVDPRRRPYVVIDPRAGHGPGIGGFKDDSQVGVALRGGHPVYFVIFYPEPEPEQTLLDVCAAEARFIRTVRELHPDSSKPAIVGNCQGGWAAMMLAAANPDDTGPIVINGAPMSYWGGAWAEGEGDNPMRYAGGLLGGSWLASLTADLGNGTFDGAYLVQNFENLNPANTFWDKYYHLFANVDKEPPRFLEFERWWGGFFLMNREEIEWIVRNLFVGNKLWSGTRQSDSGKLFDLRDIKVPIVLFASMGDNITPPQQAFNWVADIYGSTEEIKARGQTIVGLVHQDIGHLGIFVSGRVAKKEHAQIVSVLKSIERLPAGLWAMQIHERKRADGGVEYDVDFTERSLEEVAARLNRFQRKDEKPFEAAAAVSELNQRFYETFVRPFVQATSSDFAAELGRRLHPLRFARWAASDLNPAMWWLGPAAAAVKANRQPVGADQMLRRGERFGSEIISASFDLYRELRDAASEAAFFQCYGPMFLFNPPDSSRGGGLSVERAADPRELSYVRDALQAIDKGGYTEAVARAAFMLMRKDEPLPVWRLQFREEFAETYRDLLPEIPQDEWRRIRGQQEIITRFEPERAMAALPTLLSKPEDRRRFLTLLDRLLKDERVQVDQATPQQRAALARIQEVLGDGAESRGPVKTKRAVK